MLAEDNANVRENLRSVFNVSPTLFDEVFLNILRSLYSKQHLMLCDFNIVSNLCNVEIFANYSTETSQNSLAVLDERLTVYFNSVAKLFTLNPKQLKDKIMSLVCIRMEFLQNSGLNHLNRAKVEFKNFKANEYKSISNNIDILTSNNALRRNIIDAPEKQIKVTSNCKIVTLDGPVTTLFVNDMIQYQEDSINAAKMLGKNVNPYIKSVANLDISKQQKMNIHD